VECKTNVLIKKNVEAWLELISAYRKQNLFELLKKKQPPNILLLFRIVIEIVNLILMTMLMNISMLLLFPMIMIIIMIMIIMMMIMIMMMIIMMMIMVMMMMLMLMMMMIFPIMRMMARLQVTRNRIIQVTINRKHFIENQLKSRHHRSLLGILLTRTFQQY